MEVFFFAAEAPAEPSTTVGPSEGGVGSDEAVVEIKEDDAEPVEAPPSIPSPETPETE